MPSPGMTAMRCSGEVCDIYAYCYRRFPEWGRPLQAIAARPRAVEMARPLLTTISGILPLFVTATLAPELRADLHFTAGGLGLAAATFFATGAASSGFLGGLGERIGPGRSLRLAASVSAASMVGLALAPSLRVLLALLALAGFGQALAEPAGNLYFARTTAPGR